MFQTLGRFDARHIVLITALGQVYLAPAGLRKDTVVYGGERYAVRPSSTAKRVVAAREETPNA